MHSANKPSKPDNNTVAVRVQPGIKTALAREAANRGVPVSEIARAILEEWAEGRTFAARMQFLEERVDGLYAKARGETTVSMHTNPAPMDRDLDGPIIATADHVLPMEAARLSGVPADDHKARDTFYARVRRGKHPEWVSSEVRTPQGSLLYRRRSDS